MVEDPWDGKPQVETFTSGPIDMGAGYNTLTITYYPASKMDDWLERLRDYYKTIEKQAGTLKFLFGDEGIKATNLMKIQIWREKAEKWDTFFEKPEARVKAVEKLLEAQDKLEAIRAYVEDCWLKGGVPIWVLERLDSILGTEHGKVLKVSE